jgi:hypothetical protein
MKPFWLNHASRARGSLEEIVVVSKTPTWLFSNTSTASAALVLVAPFDAPALLMVGLINEKPKKTRAKASTTAVAG